MIEQAGLGVIREKLHQKAFFILVRRHCVRVPELASVYAVPNGSGLKGGFASNRGIIIDQLDCGMEPGAFDINVDVARHGFHGMRIELKSESGAPSKEQMAWYNRHRANGYHADIYVGHQQAWAALMWYLGVAREVYSRWNNETFSFARFHEGKGVRRAMANGCGPMKGGKSTHPVSTAVKRTPKSTNVSKTRMPLRPKTG